MNLTFIEYEPQKVLAAFRQGQFDGLEVIGQAEERDFFQRAFQQRLSESQSQPTIYLTGRDCVSRLQRSLLFMRPNLLIVAVLVLASSGFGLVGCKKSEGPATTDPHSADGVMLQLKAQGHLLKDALLRKDYRYIHDFGYYFSGLAQAFFSKLDDAQKQRLRGPLGELVNLSSQLDRASGGQRAEATEATVQRLLAVLNDLDKQFQEMKKGS